MWLSIIPPRLVAVSRTQSTRRVFFERYTINRLFNNSALDDIDVRTRPSLADDGFGILTEVDVQATMKKKLGVETPPYRILGACNSKMAHQVEPRVGAMLPCNVILREVDGGVEVSAIDLVASMQAILKIQSCMRSQVRFAISQRRQ